MAETADMSLLQKLVDRAVQERLQPLQSQLWAHHWLLAEMTRQLPRPALLSTAQRLNQMWLHAPEGQKAGLRGVQEQWHLYLLQLGAVVEGETPPEFHPGRPVPPRVPPAL